MADDIRPLAAGFAAPSRARWEAKAGPAASAALHTRPPDGAAPPRPAVGRGLREIRQRHDDADPKAANAAILRDLERGATGILLGPDAARDPAAALEGVDLDLAPVFPDAGAEGIEAAERLEALWRARGHDPAPAFGGFGLDPHAVGHAAAARFAADRPGVPAILIRGRGEGARELAGALADLAAVLRGMEAAGIAPDAAARQISLTLSADAEIFATIAKFRAARFTLDHLLAACGAGGVRIAIDADIRAGKPGEPWKNLLRATAACLAAACGGAGAVTVPPHSLPDGRPDALARRLARNVPIVLAEESHVARVADPAAGAWAIEHLTRELAEDAWARFRTLDAEGAR